MYTINLNVPGEPGKDASPSAEFVLANCPLLLAQTDTDRNLGLMRKWPLTVAIKRSPAYDPPVLPSLNAVMTTTASTTINNTSVKRSCTQDQGIMGQLLSSSDGEVNKIKGKKEEDGSGEHDFSAVARFFCGSPIFPKTPIARS